MFDLLKCVVLKINVLKFDVLKSVMFKFVVLMLGVGKLVVTCQYQRPLSREMSAAIKMHYSVALTLVWPEFTLL